MAILNSETYLSYYTSSLEPVRDQNGNIISITSSEHQINEVEQFVERSSIYTYYTSSYLGQIFDFEFKELSVSSDEKTIQAADIPPGAIIISQSEYDYLITTNSSLQIEVEQLKTVTGSLYETIDYLELTIESLLEIIGGGSASLNPTITTGQLPQGYINEFYNATVDVVGGVPPYIWTVESGIQLPTGLSLNAQTGIISGTPVQLFNADVTFKVADFLQKYDFKAIRLFIKEPPPPPPSSSLTITTPWTLKSGFEDEYYEKQLVAGGGVPPYVWSLLPANYLPDNLTLLPEGWITGIPIERTPPDLWETFTIKVKDSQNNETTKLFRMRIKVGI